MAKRPTSRAERPYDDAVEGGDNGRLDEGVEELKDENEPAEEEDEGSEDYEDDEGVDRAAWPEIHKEALLEYERAWERERLNIEEAYDDLRFKRGRITDQWDAEALAVRVGRPKHVNNKIPQFVRQVTGDQRQMRPSIKVVPVDGQADVDVATVRSGIIRYVENRSHAKWIYNQAGDSQVACGIGHWEVLTEYSHAATFQQELRVGLIEDGVAVLWDADAKLLTREDANHCFVPNDRTTAAFKKDWPDATASGFDTSLAGTGKSAAFDNWATDDFVREMIYWKKKPYKRLLIGLADGTVEDVTDRYKKATPEERKAVFAEARAQGLRIEWRDSYRICRYLLTMREILEEKNWKGMYIPVVPVIGEETRIGREVHRTGLVRPVKDLQRMVNYYASSETEVVALQPKAPYIGTKKMFQDRYDLWDTANSENHPFLEYTPDPLAPGLRPERVRPPDASSAIQQGAINAANDMKEVLGIYNSNLGQKSNEVSGVALRERDRQGDTGTFLYIDNMALAVAHTGRVINDLARYIYDTQRQMRIIGEDGKQAIETLNRVTMVNGQKVIENDMSAGAYDIEMEQGPSYATRREEMRDGMRDLAQAAPAIVPLIIDLIAEAQDWPKAQVIAERAQELLPPPIKAKLEAEKAERERVAGKPPAPPDPQQAQQKQQEQQMQQLQQQEIGMKMAEQKAKTDKAEADAKKAQAEADKAQLELQILRQRLAAAHMGELRSIEAHDHDIIDRHQGRQHTQDLHEIDLARQGMDQASADQAAQQAYEQGDEAHQFDMQQRMQPPSPDEGIQ